MKRRVWHSTAAYAGLLAAAFVVAWLGSYRFFRAQLDNAATMRLDMQTTVIGPDFTRTNQSRSAKGASHEA